MPSSAVPPRDAAPPGQDGDGASASLATAIRTLLLVLVVVLFIWLATTVRLPEIDTLRARLESFGFWSWLVFTLGYAAVALTPIPVTLMALTAGVLFGAVQGSILSIAGALLGSVGAYWIARALGRDVILRRLGRHADTVEEHLADAGFLALLTLRVAPGLPYWPVNYGAGALGVPWAMFAGSTAVGVIPGQVSLVALGAFAVNPGVLNGTILGIGWIAVGVLTVWAARRWRRVAKDDDGD